MTIAPSVKSAEGLHQALDQRALEGRGNLRICPRCNRRYSLTELNNEIRGQVENGLGKIVSCTNFGCAGEFRLGPLEEGEKLTTAPSARSFNGEGSPETQKEWLREKRRRAWEESTERE